MRKAILKATSLAPKCLATCLVPSSLETKWYQYCHLMDMPFFDGMICRQATDDAPQISGISSSPQPYPGYCDQKSSSSLVIPYMTSPSCSISARSSARLGLQVSDSEASSGFQSLLLASVSEQEPVESESSSSRIGAVIPESWDLIATGVAFRLSGGGGEVVQSSEPSSTDNCAGPCRFS